jgi:hypothetical protein
MKAVLSAAGADEERLMGIGHELDRCFSMALQTGLYPSRASCAVANLMDALAVPHALQAFDIRGFWTGSARPSKANGTLNHHLDVVAEAVTRRRPAGFYKSTSFQIDNFINV